MRFENVTILEFDHSTDHDTIKEDARQMWINFGLGNDTSYVGWDHKEMAEDYPFLAAAIESAGQSENKNLLIHWWW